MKTCTLINYFFITLPFGGFHLSGFKTDWVSRFSWSVFLFKLLTK